MSETNPIPTQQETLDRISKIRKRALVDGYRSLTLKDGTASLALVQARADVLEMLDLFDARAAVAGLREDAAFIPKVAALPCARVDGDECFYFEREVATYCASCHAKYLIETSATSSPTPAESLLRDPVKVRVLPTPIVTRDGVPCEDQAAALEEFKERCRAAAVDKGERPLTTSESTIMESDADMARDRPAPPERTRAGGETSARTIWGKSAGTCHHSRLMPECMSCLLGHASRMEHQVREMSAAPADNDAESLLQHVAYSGVEFDDNRMGYVVVQIDRDVWERIKKLAPTPTKGDR